MFSGLNESQVEQVVEAVNAVLREAHAAQ
jgi:hypothetical protein